ncbi:hypothetical protein PHOBOS_10 [Erwinia phage vB_EamM_Phobos]|uniref:hypothetical protein n=1 Tax=Erwinia phage vB_EamM_Phobos TaxID=1883377 RepID=UPI00081CCC17|nr:hypothetical protein BIZ79_gp010 [Erwinia phage vB_EamM_Phobos]ANZ50200.1 hypothetical protein PHOBOS_10 [Erwinia phage vB_EamM_Phobos]
MFNFKFYPADIHGWFWDAVAESGYADTLRMRTREQEQMTVDMLNCALFDIFKSVEQVPNFSYDVLLSRYIDPVKLYDKMRAVKDVYPSREIIIRTERENLFDPTSPLVNVPVVITTRPNDTELAYIAFKDAYRKFRDKVELMIRRATGEQFNRYAIVTLTITDDQLGRVRSIDIKLQGDIRLRYYMEQFPDGRFDSGKGGGH